MYTKWQSNIEKHRGYIQTHRFDASYSERYAAMENVFIKIAEDDKNIQGKKETIYKMDTVQKNLLETFLTGRNNALMFSKGNVDENGKATIVDPDSSRPIYISDGLIP